MANNNVAFALGLAQKAGKVASGDFAVRSALKSGKAKLLVVAEDAAPNSKKDMYYLAEVAGVEVVELLTRDELGYAIGKAKRTAVVITDTNFAKMINKK
jgi:ribosomal protein L7Ae-like RNA K-turn-binding protein